jgi:hypothetical protein
MVDRHAPLSVDPVFADQIRALYDDLITRNLSNVLVAALLAAVLVDVHPVAWVAAWFVGIVLVHALRVGALHALRERSRGAPDVDAMVRGFAFWLVVVSLYWGLTVALLVVPSDHDTQAVLALALGGLCAGGISANAYHLPSLLTRLVLMIVPFSVRVIAIGDAFSVYIGLGMLARACGAAVTVQTDGCEG